MYTHTCAYPHTNICTHTTYIQKGKEGTNPDFSSTGSVEKQEKEQNPGAVIRLCEEKGLEWSSAVRLQ